MTALENYFRSLSEIRNTGSATKETSFYGPLETLLNELGQQLKPKVRCVMQLKQQGAGMPDGGLFSARQFQRSGQLKDPTNPERGVIEVKGTGEAVSTIAQSQQVSKYWQRYGQVLVTNYRDFVLVGRDALGQPVNLESFSLAASEQVFWQKAQDANAFAKEQEEQLAEYLKRVMLHQAVITSPQDLAWFLASYAKDARARIDKTDLPNLVQVREALEEALGVGFQGEKGDRFFKSTLIQTLFYGIFSAWVLWHRQASQERFSWREAVWYMRVPMIQALFSKVATPMNLGRLDLVEVLDWAGEALNRVDREAFFTKFEEAQAVQYFYEPFLQAFDPQLRKDLGVWYTPPEIVQYMVARVDTMLREELHITDGLADPNVYILDPCCGTGAFLVEVLRKIDETLKANGADALGGSDLKQAAMERVFGFEILTAPFVVAHLQLGLLLQNLGVPLVDENERVGVYLTNALTGWQPPDDKAKESFRQLGISYPELEEEREAADEVKREKPILVVLGNPPYNAFAGISQIQDISVEKYKSNLAEVWNIKKFNLDDLYIRFFRLAEHCITEREPGEGIVCFISNASYLSDPSYVVMRQELLSKFHCFWFDNMNGDSRETGKITPDGKPDPSVFSTEYNREGIQVGTAISLMLRKNDETPERQILFRNFWGVEKRSELLLSLLPDSTSQPYKKPTPSHSNRFSFVPVNTYGGYLDWPRVIDLCREAPINGLAEKRGKALIDIDKSLLEERMQIYFNPSSSWQDIQDFVPGLANDAGRFDAKKARQKILEMEVFSESKIHRYLLSPFDLRWCYHTNTRPLWNEPRPSLSSQAWKGNSFIITRMVAERSGEQVPLIHSCAMPDHHALRPNVVAIPIFWKDSFAELNSQAARQKSIFDLEVSGSVEDSGQSAIRDNLSSNVKEYLAHIETSRLEPWQNSELIWMHVLAISYSTLFLAENSDGVLQDWLRIPLPNFCELLIASANLGKQIAALLDTETPVSGVTTGKLRDDIKTIAPITRIGGGQLNPDTDLALTANWGYSGKGGITMPSKGRITIRPYTNAEPQNNFLGTETCDIYLNDVAYWKNVPSRVWNYTIGGYQVIKKWLSYREAPLLGRPLKPDEVREVTNMARRIAAILLLEPALNANYEAIKSNTYPWPSSNS